MSVVLDYPGNWIFTQARKVYGVAGYTSSHLTRFEKAAWELGQTCLCTLPQDTLPRATASVYSKKKNELVQRIKQEAKQMTTLETYMRLFVGYAKFVSKMGLYHKILHMERNGLECTCGKCKFVEEEENGNVEGPACPCQTPTEKVYNRIKKNRIRRFRKRANKRKRESMI